jgi:DNA-binding NarL/FixJ family response regulator
LTQATAAEVIEEKPPVVIVGDVADGQQGPAGIEGQATDVALCDLDRATDPAAFEVVQSYPAGGTLVPGSRVLLSGLKARAVIPVVPTERGRPSR